MLQGIAIQAMQARSGVVGANPQAGQVLIIPAAKMVFRRYISGAAPKKQWRMAPAYAYDLSDPRVLFGSAGVANALDRPWADRATADWHLTNDPVGFQITDDEYREMVSTRKLPRNVALRYQRALDAVNAHVVGAKATPAELFVGCAPGRLERTVVTPDHTDARLTARLKEADEAIRTHDLSYLHVFTPHVARARGAGAHRNEHDLPGLIGADPAEAPSVIESAPVAPAPAPVAYAPRTAAPGAVKPGDRIIAGDGVPYVARRVVADERDLSDVELFRRAYAESMNVLLLGEPGTGKTRGLLAAFPDAIVVSVTGDTEVADLIGSYVPTGPDSFVWQDGPLLKGMLEGRMVVMDEGGLADSKVLALLYPLMDKKGEARQILVTANPARGIVKAKDGFGIAFTSNPNAKGVHIAEPLLSRCAITMTVTTDYAVMRDLGCNERLVQAAEHMAKQRESGEIGWAPEARNLLDARDIEAKFGIVMALRSLIMQAPEMEREVVEIQLRERFGDIPGAAKKVKALGV